MSNKKKIKQRNILAFEDCGIYLKGRHNINTEDNEKALE